MQFESPGDDQPDTINIREPSRRPEVAAYTVPRLVSLSLYEEFVEQRGRDGDKLLNDLLRILEYFLPHLALIQVFDNRNVTDALIPSSLEFPPAREYYGKVVHYCLETNWGRRAEAA